MSAVVAVLMFAAMAGVACSSPVAEVRIKGPRDAIEAAAVTPTFPTFERVGEAIHLRASAFDARGVFLGPAKVDWTSSAPDVATVSPEGVVTVVSSGDFVITARARSSSIEARQPLTAIVEQGIRILPPEVRSPGARASARPRPRGDVLELALGQTLQMRAEVLDDRGRVIEGARVRWRTTTFAATVTPDGELEGRAIGAAQVVAESRAGHLARLDLSVVDWPSTRRRSG